MAVILLPRSTGATGGAPLAASNSLATWFLGLTAVLGAGAISWVNFGVGLLPLLAPRPSPQARSSAG